MKYIKQAFTLVELIVVITILAILATIAFTSLQGYSKDARNSTRISDTSSVKLALELYILQTGKYPLPGNSIDITGTGGVILWKKGIVDMSVITKLQKISALPTDPKTGTEMEYATTLNQKEYEIKYNLELAASPSPLRRGIGVRLAQAANTTPYVQGTYNGLYLLGDDLKYYAVPGLHTSSGITVSIPVSFDLNNKTIDNYQVVPLSYSGVSLNANNLKTNYLNFGLALKAAFATTPELNNGIYATVAGLNTTTAAKFAKEITTGTYQAPVVVLGDPCVTNPTYSTGSIIGTYNIPEITDTQTWTGTGNVNENNGVFQYTLNLECSKGVYINQIETGPVFQECNLNHTRNGAIEQCETDPQTLVRTYGNSALITTVDVGGTERTGNTVNGSSDWTPVPLGLGSDTVGTKIKFNTTVFTDEIWGGLTFSPAGGTIKVTIDKGTGNEVSTIINTYSATVQKDTRTLFASGLVYMNHTIELELLSLGNTDLNSKSILNVANSGLFSGDPNHYYWVGDDFYMTGTFSGGFTRNFWSTQPINQENVEYEFEHTDSHYANCGGGYAIPAVGFWPITDDGTLNATSETGYAPRKGFALYMYCNIMDIYENGSSVNSYNSLTNGSKIKVYHDQSSGNFKLYVNGNLIHTSTYTTFEETRIVAAISYPSASVIARNARINDVRWTTYTHAFDFDYIEEVTY